MQNTHAYRLTSTPLIHAPGIFDYLRCMYLTAPDQARHIAGATWPRIDDATINGLLCGGIATSTVRDAVCFKLDHALSNEVTL